jgi:integrase
LPFENAQTVANFVRKHTGIEGFHVHRTRHTFACRWLERGGSLEALRQILGHSTVRTTERYGRISDDIVRREAERVDRAMGSRVGSSPEAKYGGGTGI